MNFQAVVIRHHDIDTSLYDSGTTLVPDRSIVTDDVDITAHALYG